MKYLLFVLLLLTSCSGTKTGIFPTDNPNIVVERVFSFENCTVFRFSDSVNGYNYFSVCNQ